MSEPENRPKPFFASRYPWLLVGMLWFCGFFNYADRQAVNAVMTLIKADYQLTNEQAGTILSAFMIVYAIAGPFAGFLVDKISRRWLIVTGLGFWSLIAAGTGFARSYWQLIFFRGAEGLGESAYFPASMSILSDYHGPRTRSRAMGIHQTSVYFGVVGGSVFAGLIANHYGWRMPFYIFGAIGIVYSIALMGLIKEPPRGGFEAKPEVVEPRASFLRNAAELLQNPAAAAQMCVFVGANLVTMSIVTWMPTHVGERFSMGLVKDNFTATFYMQLGSFFGSLLGGFGADHFSRYTRGGRTLVQAFGLICGAPCVYLIGATYSQMWLIAGLLGVGIAKGIYESNIFAALFDVIAPRLRGSAAGLINSVGWAGASLGTYLIGVSADRKGVGSAIGSIAIIYAIAACLAIFASWLAVRRPTSVTPIDVLE